MQYRHATATHLGKVRQNNEDRFLCAARPPAGAIYCVADGMGGHAAGEVASALACATLDRMAEELLDPATDPIEALRSAVAVANDVILRAVAGRPEWGGMGTTLTVALCRERAVHIGQVGDSRCYWVRGSQCKQVTSDQARGHVLFNVLGSHRGSFSGAEVKHLGAGRSNLD
jgi:protein phosphatase